MLKIFYWLSIILPVIDAVRGVVVGVKKGLDDSAREKAEKLQDEMFRKANEGGAIIDDKQ